MIELIPRGDSKITILLVNSGSEIAAPLLLKYQEELRSLKSHLIHAETPQEGLEVLLKQPVDLVLFFQAGLDTAGWQALEDLSRTGASSLIMITPHEDASTMAEAIRRGAYDCLSSRTLEAETLSRAIRHALEHKQIKAEYAENVRRYNLLTHSTVDVIWSIDLSFRLTSISPSVTHLRGYTAEEALSQSIPDMLTPDSLAVVLKALTEQQDLERQKNPDVSRAWKAELEMNCKDGSTVWTETKMTFLRDGTGKVTGIFGVSREISSRKEADLKIRLAEEKYRTVFENSAVAITVTDEEERIISWNKYAEDLLGMGREDLYMRPVHELYPEEEWNRMQSLNIRKKGMLLHFETQIAKKDGSHLDVVISVTVLKTADGGKTGSIGIIQNIAERKQAERKLRLAEEKYRTIFENSAMAITVTDEYERIIQWNRCAEKLFGFTHEEFHQKPVKELYPEAEWKRMQSMNIRNKGMMHHLEAIALRKDGSQFDIDISVTVLTTPDGGKTGSIGLIQDITERKETERKIHIAEEQYRTIFENSAVAITVTDADERIISWNHLAEELLGMTAEELFQCPVKSLYANEEWLRLQSLNLRKKGITRNVETQITKKDGKTIDVELCITVLRTADGGKSGSIGIIQDITERKEAERKVRAAEEKYRMIFDNSPVAITIANKDGVIVSWNKFAEELLARTYDDFFGKTVESLYPADEWHKIQTLHITQTGTGHFETKMLKGNGEIMEVKTSVSVLTDMEGRITGSIGIIRDITERNRMMAEMKKAREQAEAANSAKSDFLSNMSHEIRTPMNGILGMIELLLDSPLKEEQREYAEHVKNSAESLLTIINDILDFSKVEAGKMTLENIPFDLWTSIEDVASMLAIRTQQKGLEMIVRFSPDTPRRVIGDPGRIRQVLINLAGNAIKFTAKGYILINVDSVPKEGGLCEFKISVEDTGIGIPDDKIDYVFDKFTQADTSTTRRYGGTGLGLAICKQLSELMGGRVGAQSKVGKGSTFWFTITCPVDATSPAVLPKGELTGLTVLIVDDHELNRKILNEQMANWGIQTECVSSAQDALDALRRAKANGRTYDMALLDYQLPAMNGLELAQAIKADPDLQKTELVMLTSMGQRGDAKKMEEAGVSAYLIKPVRQVHLYDALSLVWGTKDKKIPSKLLTRFTLLENKMTEEKQKKTAAAVSARVLLAEDNLINQKVARKMLEKLGCTVDVVADGVAALVKIKSERYDMIFMDCQMPEMDGYETSREIRRLAGPLSKIPIIALTANAMDGDRDKCLAAGMNDYLSKPVKNEELEQKIRHWHIPRVSVPISDESQDGVQAPTQNSRESRIGEPIILDPKRMAVLKEYTDGNDLFFVDELFETFFKSSDDRFRLLERALGEGKSAEAKLQAHTLKGSGSNLGALKFADVCDHLERACLENRIEDAKRFAAEAQREYEVVRQEFEGKWRVRRSA